MDSNECESQSDAEIIHKIDSDDVETKDIKPQQSDGDEENHAHHHEDETGIGDEEDIELDKNI